MKCIRLLLPSLLALLLVACGNQPPAPTSNAGSNPTVAGDHSGSRSSRPNVTLKKGGGYYKDDGPGDDIPDNLDAVPDATPRWEPLNRLANRPYVVLGRSYEPMTTLQDFQQRGTASWYGKKFHGQNTSIGEPYDMFGMTAAHPTLPLPSYARVTSVETGKSVIVRINDRGPFHADRIMDLSYTAAYKLGFVGKGSGEVIVQSIRPGSDSALPMLAAETSAQSASDSQLMRRELAPASAPVAKGVYLQLGAFANGDNARNLSARFEHDLDWLGQPIRVNASGGIYRLHIGPYASRADAEAVAARIQNEQGFRPSIVVR
jgi:rare lipoprotein A